MQHGWQQAKRGLLAPQVLLIVLMVVLIEAAALIAIPRLARSLGLRTSNGLDSFASGAALATTVVVLLGVVVVLSGGVNWLTGAMAERSTGKLLAALGPDWKMVHNLIFEEGRPPDTWVVDVDHVAIGPHGVLVMESKYSSQAIDIEATHLTKQLRKDAAQVAQNANRVRRLLASKGLTVPVQPILVYWGWRIHATKTPIREMGRVWVVMGAEADRWRSQLPAERIGRETEEAAWAALMEHAVAVHDPHDN